MVHVVCLLEVALACWMMIRVCSWGMIALIPEVKVSEAVKKKIPMDRFEEGGGKIAGSNTAALCRDKGAGAAGICSYSRQHKGQGTSLPPYCRTVSERLNSSGSHKLASCTSNDAPTDY